MNERSYVIHHTNFSNAAPHDDIERQLSQLGTLLANEFGFYVISSIHSPEELRDAVQSLLPDSEWLIVIEASTRLAHGSWRSDSLSRLASKFTFD